MEFWLLVLFPDATSFHSNVHDTARLSNIKNVVPFVPKLKNVSFCGRNQISSQDVIHFISNITTLNCIRLSGVWQDSSEDASTWIKINCPKMAFTFINERNTTLISHLPN